MAEITNDGVSQSGKQLITTVPYNYTRHFFYTVGASQTQPQKVGTLLYGFSYDGNDKIYLFDTVSLWSDAIAKIGMPPSAEGVASQIVVQCQWRLSGLTWNSLFDDL